MRRLRRESKPYSIYPRYSGGADLRCESAACGTAVSRHRFAHPGDRPLPFRLRPL
jgi:hypothetical protein